MHNFELLATEVFQILRSYDFTVAMYNDEKDVTFEPEECRFFVAKPKNILVAIQDENDNSTLTLVLTKSCDLEEFDPLIQTFRTTANKYNTLFHIHNTDDDQIDVQGYGTQSMPIREGKNPMTELVEMMYGTSRSSYLAFENAKMIVRHKKGKRIEEDSQRTRNIASVFVENAQGERFLMPTNNLMAGRAMTQHVNQGGSWADQVGQQINRMAADFQDLGQAVSFVDTNVAVIAEGANISERCRCARKDIREMFQAIYRTSTYEAACHKLNEMGEQPLVEGPVLENLRETLRVEGKKDLPESVITAIARAMNEGEGERALDEEAGPAAHPAPAPGKPVSNDVSVLGKSVDSSAWEKFKKGEIVLRHSVELPTPLPQNWNHDYGKTEKLTADGKALFALTFIVPLIRDDSLSNLINSAGDQLAKLKDKPGAKNYRVVVYAAVRAAGLGHILEDNLGPRGVEAVRQLEEWFRGFLPHRVLMEEEAEVEDVEQNEGEDSVEESVLTDEDLVLPKKTQGQSLADEVMSRDPTAIAFGREAPDLQVMKTPMPMALAEGTKEWNEGARHAKTPHGRADDCPYASGERQKDWLDGFNTEFNYDENGDRRTDEEFDRIMKNAGLKR